MIQIEYKKGFTMAEVLITMGILGVVAAMTFPALIEGYKKKETVAKLQKAYTILNQAFYRSQADNGDYRDWLRGVDIGLEKFYDIYWYPYFQITIVCDTYKKCGYKEQRPWKRPDSAKVQPVFTDANFRVPFITSDNILYSISIAYGSADNASNLIFVDINASRLPNLLGNDVFVFVTTENNVIMPLGYDKTQTEVLSDCKTTGEFCAAKIMQNGWQIKQDYPWHR